MNDFKDRLVNERNELEEKLAKLCGFLDTETFYNLSLMQQNLLTAQKHAMSSYHTILNMRLADLSMQDDGK